MKRRVLFLIIVLLLAAGCSGAPAVNESAQPVVDEAAPTALPTDLPPVPTISPTNTIPPTSLPSPTNAKIQVATLNLRSGPSILHDIIKLYPQGETVSVIGHAPGFEWAKVVTADGKTGWMLAAFMELEKPINDTLEMPISESLMATGKVVDQDGKGIPGIQVGLTYVGTVERVRITGTTMLDGVFIAYAPIEYQGPWISTIVGIGCTSPIVDANCRYNGKFTPLEGINVQLPQDVKIEFVYQ